MHISLIIPSYNRYSNLVRLLSLIDSQEQTKLKIEVIVICDDPNSKEEYKKLEDNEYKFNLKLIYNNVNLGVSKSRDRGIMVSEGEFLLILDDDMRPVNKSLLSSYYNEAQNHTKTVFSGNILHPEASNRFQEFINSSATYFGFLNIAHLSKIPFSNAVSGSILIPRSIFFEEGLTFENSAERNWNYGYEDLILMARIDELGYDFRFNKKAITVHTENYTLLKIANRKYAAGSKIKSIIEGYPKLTNLLVRPGMNLWPFSFKIPNKLLEVIEWLINKLRLPNIFIKIILGYSIYSGYKKGQV